MTQVANNNYSLREVDELLQIVFVINHVEVYEIFLCWVDHLQDDIRELYEGFDVFETHIIKP
jgi:hypothetical protein